MKRVMRRARTGPQPFPAAFIDADDRKGGPEPRERLSIEGRRRSEREAKNDTRAEKEC